MRLPLHAALALAFGLAGCGGADQQANQATPPDKAATETADAEQAQLPACPFHDTRNWTGSVEGGRVLVTGTVDLLMAGFKPQLTEHAGAAPDTLALDLALVPEANAAVNDQVRYESAGGGYRRGEIWCGGERIASFDMILVG